MIHNWIGWCERIPQKHLNSQSSFTCSYNYPIKYVHPHVQTKRLPVMGGVPCDIVDYPQNEYWLPPVCLVRKRQENRGHNSNPKYGRKMP